MSPNRDVYRIYTAFAVALVAAVALTGCSGTTGTTLDTAPSLPLRETPMASSPNNPPGSSTASDRPTRATAPTSDTVGGSTPLLLDVNGSTISARLDGSAVSDSLVEQLPLTLPVRDFGGQEKVADLPKPLDLDGAPAGSGAEPGLIGYYVPDQRLILYYEQVGYHAGIAPLGTFDDVPAIEGAPDGTTLTLRIDE